MIHNHPSDTWERGSPYEQYVGRWSRQVAPRFLSWLGMPAGRRWLDVGCGTGALCAAIVDHCSPSWVAGVEPSLGFLQTAKVNLRGLASLYQGSATAIPLDNRSADVVVSGLALNFVPDPDAALAEMARVTTRGGTIAAYVWDYGGKMELIRVFWDAAVELDAGALNTDEGLRFPLMTTGSPSSSAKARLPPTRCRLRRMRERACATVYGSAFRLRPMGRSR